MLLWRKRVDTSLAIPSLEPCRCQHLLNSLLKIMISKEAENAGQVPGCRGYLCPELR